MKQWNCDNACKGECCSYLFVELNSFQEELFRTEMSFSVNLLHREWLLLHPCFEAQGPYLVHLKQGIKCDVVTNPINQKRYLYIPDSRCRNLMANGRCKAYRTRPEVCKYGSCINNTNQEWLKWLGEFHNGVKK